MLIYIVIFRRMHVHHPGPDLPAGDPVPEHAGVEADGLLVPVAREQLRGLHIPSPHGVWGGEAVPHL